MKKVYINVTYLEYWELPDETSDEEIEKKVEQYIKEEHPNCSDKDFDICPEV